MDEFADDTTEIRGFEHLACGVNIFSRLSYLLLIIIIYFPVIVIFALSSQCPWSRGLWCLVPSVSVSSIIEPFQFSA